MITREADYAVRAVAQLANLDNGASVSCAELSENTGVPYRFLRKIVRKLAASDIIESRRGRSGGIRLSHPAAKINLLDVICAIDARGTRLNVCFDQAAGCPRAATCRVYKRLKPVQQDLDRRLAGISLADVAE